jgi:NADPH2:quinone reductase
LKASVLKEFGGPEVLRLEDVPVPQPTPGEILLKVHSVSVNRTLDLIVRAGRYPVKIQLPHVLGADPAGEVVEIGGGVTKFKVGDRVAVISAVPCQQCGPCLKGEEANCVDSKRIGIDLWGGYAQLIALPARYAVKLPDEISFQGRRMRFGHGRNRRPGQFLRSGRQDARRQSHRRCRL